MKIFRLLSSAFILVCVILSPMAHAQDQWRYQLSPYLWFAGLKGDVATIPGAPPASIDISPTEALQDLKVGLMGAFDAKKGRHGGFADLVYTDVRSDTDLVPAIGLTLKSISKTTLFSAGYMYELYKNESAVVDLLAGARYWGIDTELEFGGGLGILAGDHLKSASDLGVPLVGVGLLYQQGYFRQYLNQAGWQQEAYEDNDFLNLPLTLVCRPDGTPVTVEVQYQGRPVFAQIWRAQVGRVSLYLLDTNIEANTRAEDRDTRGLISMAISSSVSGFWANCTLHPPAKLPSARMIMIAWLRISW